MRINETTPSISSPILPPSFSLVGRVPMPMCSQFRGKSRSSKPLSQGCFSGKQASRSSSPFPLCLLEINWLERGNTFRQHGWKYYFHEKAILSVISIRTTGVHSTGFEICGGLGDTRGWRGEARPDESADTWFARRRPDLFGGWGLWRGPNSTKRELGGGIENRPWRCEYIATFPLDVNHAIACLLLSAATSCATEQPTNPRSPLA